MVEHHTHPTWSQNCEARKKGWGGMRRDGRGEGCCFHVSMG